MEIPFSPISIPSQYLYFFFLKMQFKVLLLGNCGAGKSVLLENYQKDQQKPEELPPPTINVDTKSKVVHTDLGDVKLSLNDTPGLMQYSTVIGSYARSANAVMLFFAINESDSFKDLQPWFDLVKKNCEDQLIYLVATKSDLEWKYTKEELDQFSKEKHAELFITAWNGLNTTKEMFKKIATDLAKKSKA